MAITFSNTALSVNVQRNLAQHTLSVQRSLERLSSGLRITRAADDPAGLAVALRLASKVRGTERAIQNALDGISLLQIGEGALNEVSSILIRLRELALQSANGTLRSAQRSAVDQEAQDLIAEIDRIAEVSAFNEVSLLNGSPGITLQTGPNRTDTLELPTVDTRAAQLGATAAVSTIDLGSETSARSALGVLDEAIDQISSARASFGTTQTRLESQIRSLRVSAENLEAARSRIQDVDVAQETASLVRSQILQRTSIALLAQVNQQPQIALQLLQATFR